MRIRAAIAASVLATTIVMGGASATLAHGKEYMDGHHKRHGSCWLYAAIDQGGPVFSEGCSKGGWGGRHK